MSQNLTRFKIAQSRDYQTALAEIRAGKKQSHWMWYIFPQLEGIGFSEISHYYGIRGMEEARAYLADDMKLKSSMTLFLLATQNDSAYEKETLVFKGVLEKFFDGKMDERTVKICGIT